MITDWISWLRLLIRRTGIGLVEDFGRDVRYGVRQLRRSPAFAAAALLCLALGIGRRRRSIFPASRSPGPSARDLKLDQKIGSLTLGKEADIIPLNAEAINVAPLNVVPGAVVSLMERSNVETVIVAGKVLKWEGRLLNVNLSRLRQQLEDSRDFLFDAAGIPQNLFRPN